jgi:hypothetical protein
MLTVSRLCASAQRTPSEVKFLEKASERAAVSFCQRRIRLLPFYPSDECINSDAKNRKTNRYFGTHRWFKNKMNEPKDKHRCPKRKQREKDHPEET